MVNLNLLAPSWWTPRPYATVDDDPVEEVVWLDHDQHVFYRLTSNPLGIVRVTDVCAWHDRWQARVGRLQRALGLREGA